jgi:hypothetical protein
MVTSTMMIVGGFRCGDRHEWWESSVRSAASHNRQKKVCGSEDLCGC